VRWGVRGRESAGLVHSHTFPAGMTTAGFLVHLVMRPSRKILDLRADQPCWGFPCFCSPRLPLASIGMLRMEICPLRRQKRHERRAHQRDLFRTPRCRQRRRPFSTLLGAMPLFCRASHHPAAARPAALRQSPACNLRSTKIPFRILQQCRRRSSSPGRWDPAAVFFTVIVRGGDSQSLPGYVAT
jgi:hypothetical protein